MNILDKRFKYTNAASTDLAKTFRRIRAEQKAKQEQDKRNAAEAQRKVASLHGRNPMVADKGHT